MQAGLVDILGKGEFYTIISMAVPILHIFLQISTFMSARFLIITIQYIVK